MPSRILDPWSLHSHLSCQILSMISIKKLLTSQTDTDISISTSVYPRRLQKESSRYAGQNVSKAKKYDLFRVLLFGLDPALDQAITDTLSSSLIHHRSIERGRRMCKCDFRMMEKLLREEVYFLRPLSHTGLSINKCRHLFFVRFGVGNLLTPSAQQIWRWWLRPLHIVDNRPQSCITRSLSRSPSSDGSFELLQNICIQTLLNQSYLFQELRVLSVRSNNTRWESSSSLTKPSNCWSVCGRQTHSQLRLLQNRLDLDASSNDTMMDLELPNLFKMTEEKSCPLVECRAQS